MEDKIKVLETKVKLLESIFKIDNSTIQEQLIVSLLSIMT